MNNEPCKNRKQQCTQAVQILAPGDQFIYQAAQRIPEEKVRESIIIQIKPMANHDKPDPHPSTSIKGQLKLSHALRVKSAEYWIRLGEEDQALRELEALPKSAWNHPSAVKNRVAALWALQGRTEANVPKGLAAQA